MGYTVDSVDEALGLLLVVAHHPGLGVTELSKKSGITKPRAFRFLTTLEARGFVQREMEAATYQLGSSSLIIGLAAVVQVNLVRQAAKHMESLAKQFNENVHLRIRDGLESVSVARRDSTHDLRIHSAIGSKRPLHAGASGKLILAFEDEKLQEEVFSRELPKYTDKTVVTQAKLVRELAAIRKRGYAISAGEISVGVVSVAVPVRDGTGRVIAALGMSAPSSRATDGGERFIDALLIAAAQLSAELGYSGRTA